MEKILKNLGKAICLLIAFALTGCVARGGGDEEPRLRREFSTARLSALSAKAAEESERYLRERSSGKNLEPILVRGIGAGHDRGVAVRLIQDNHDRGCYAFWKNVASPETAVLSCADFACDDPRYEPLSVAETPSLSVELSVFGKFAAIRGPFDFRPGRDALMLIKDGDPTLIQPGVYLDRHHTKKSFVEAVCKKAKLRPDAWKDPSIKWYAAPTLRCVRKLIVSP
jgi:AMMECR1 domain-containing protein